MSRASLASLVLVLAACTANVTDGRFTCSAEADCPSGFTCNANRHCYRVETSPDGGNGTLDAPIGNDAGPCIGSACITLAVTNAFDDTLAGGTFMLETTTATMPAFGGTTDRLSVSLGDNHMLDVSYGAMSMSYPANAGMMYAVVIGPDPSSDVPLVRVLPDSFTAGNHVMFQVHMIDMTLGGATYSVQAGMQMETLTRGTDPDALMFTNGVRDALEVHVMSGAPAQDVMLAAFDSADLMNDGQFYVVLTGRPDAHLASSHGLRAIPVVPGGHAVGSAPVVYVLNASSGPIIVCDGAANLAMVPAGTIGQGLAGVSASAPANDARAFDIHAATEDCAGTADMRVAGIPWRTSPDQIVGRVLLAIVGPLGTTMWGPGAGAEAGPASTPAIQQVVTYGNGTQHEIRFGTLTDGLIERAPGPGTAYHEWIVAPTSLLVDYEQPPNQQQFAWNITTRTAAVLATLDAMTGAPVAYEITTTPGQPWLVTPASGTVAP